VIHGKLHLALIAFAGVALAGNVASAEGHRLADTKEQLRLRYDVSVIDHGDSHLAVVVRIADAGRLKPLTGVDLVIRMSPTSGSRNDDVELCAPLATSSNNNGAIEARVDLVEGLAARAEICLKSLNLDGVHETRSLKWYYHAIPLVEYIKSAEKKP
jgi:hypothetical protein